MPPLRLGELDTILGTISDGGTREWDRTRGQGLSTFLGNKLS